MTPTERYALCVDGCTVHGTAGTYPVFDPGRPGQAVLDAPWSSVDQVDAAVRAAAGAGPAWAARPLAERADLVVAAAAAGEALATDAGLAPVLTRENGKILAEAQLELALPVAIAATFAELADGALTDEQFGAGRVRALPHGVVAALIPFNWPVSVLLSKVVPALLAGNTVVAKPPPTCPGVTLAFAAAMAGALPPGVLNTVNGPGIDVGDALIRHPLVAMITLTGGSATGRAVMGAAADRLVPVLLELGGNDAAVVAPDVEPDEHLAQQLLDAALGTSGQVCLALKRLYVPEDRLDAYVELLVDRAAHTVTGHGLEPATTIGPLHTQAAARRAEALLDEAAASGGRVHRPGKVALSLAETGGNFVAPAVVAAPARTAALVTEEQFAPLVPVLGYRDLDDAVAAANDCRYALGASVWSGDDALATELRGRFEAGTTFHNCHGPGGLDPRLPFGGWKASGIGREFGADGVLAYTRRQAVQPSRPLDDR